MEFFHDGFSKTFNEVLGAIITAILFPNIEIGLTAQTKENAAVLLSDKYNEIIRFYPILRNEVLDTQFAKNTAKILFTNGSVVDILANSQTSKGQRRRRLNIEESALLNNTLFDDALKPIVSNGRMTCGKNAFIDPTELNQQINFFSTSGYRNSDEFNRTIDMIKSMANCEGHMVIGSSWFLGCWYNRGESKAQILKNKTTMSATSFAQNYESKWVGAVDGALVNINKLLSRRVLENPILKMDAKDREIYLGVDVARSIKTSNNQSSISVIEVKRTVRGKIISLDLINLIHMSNSLSLPLQAIEVCNVKKRYNARMVIVDDNGVGKGLCDSLMKDMFDSKTGEYLGCWNSINTDDLPENTKDAELVLYRLTAQSCNSEIIVNFMNIIDGEILRLLVKKQDSDYDITDKEFFETNMLPYLETNYFVDETANLQCKRLDNGKLTLVQTVKRNNKDRFSSVAYACWYIMAYEQLTIEDTSEDADAWLQFAFLGT